MNDQNMTHTSNTFKHASLTLSGFIVTTCLTMPITAMADTSSSVDAIMEQLKSFKAPVPKVSTPAPVAIKTKTKETKVESKPVVEKIAPIKEKAPIADPTPTTSVYVSPLSIQQETSTVAEPKKIKRVKRTKRVKQQRRTTTSRVSKRRVVAKKAAPKKVAKKRVTKRQVAKRSAVRKNIDNRKNGAVDYKGFDERYMSLIYDILNEKKPATVNRRTRTTPASLATTTPQGKFSGTSGWIYLGKYSAGHWRSGKTLKLGNNLPQAGQQYTVKSPLLNLRKSHPRKGSLGKLVQVLHIGDQVLVSRVHRSAKNNYWANIVRP
jgi:hypothetical protein